MQRTSEQDSGRRPACGAQSPAARGRVSRDSELPDREGDMAASSQKLVIEMSPRCSLTGTAFASELSEQVFPRVDTGGPVTC
jgi:hypothetical protein